MPGDGPHERQALQQLGEELDRVTNGAWIADDLSRDLYELEEPLAVIDSVRLLSQVTGLRQAFGRRVVHVHVTASEDTLAARFAERLDRAEVVESSSFADARADATEKQVESLAAEADVRVNSEVSSPEDVVVRVASAVGLLASGHEPVVDVIVGGLYGSEGKGNIAYYLAPEYEVLLRVGGPNAGHKVYLPTGEVYTHHHLPSGTRAGEALLIIGPGAVVNPAALLEEIAACNISADRLAIDPQVMTIAQEDIDNETELRKRIASTAQGVGEATARRVRRGAEVTLAGDVEDLKPFIRPTADVLEASYRRGYRICLEGTQGSGLSIFHGQYPYVTSRDTTASGCIAEAGIAPHRVRRVVMVVRTLPIRVANPPDGTSGPMTSELSWSFVETRAGFEPGELESKEKTSTTGTQRRVGEFEWDLLRKSALLNGPTDIALTFADYISSENRHARRFEQLTEDTLRFIEEVEKVASAPVSLIATRFHPERSVIDRRNW
jgi:adenylosuccinate synthase